MKLFMIAKNNIKRSRSATATVFLLVILSTMLLYLGCNVMLQLNSFIDEKNDKLNGSDFTVITGPQYETDVINTIKGMEGYSNIESEPCIIYVSPKMNNLDLKAKEQSIPIMIQNMEEERKISNIELIDESDTKYENAIVMPYVLKTANDYKTGDEVQIKYNDRVGVYKIYGFYEDVMFANPTNVSTYKMLVFGDSFRKAVEGAEESTKSMVIQTTLEDKADSGEFESAFMKDIKKTIADPAFSYQALNYSTMKVGTAIFINIMMVILIAFSLIIMIIALVVIRFVIVTHIESNMQNIGAMEAIGYSSSQMIQSILLEFLLIAVAGWIFGIIVSLFASPFVTNIVSSTIGLAWMTQVKVIAILVSCLIVISLILLISFITARKMKKITPLDALRGGIQTHSFKKNHLPLSKSKFNVNISIGLKALLQNKKQNFAITTIIILLSFACVFAYTMYYNFVDENSALLNLVGVETAEVTFECDKNICDRAFPEIEQMEGVEKIVKLQSSGTTLYSETKEESVNINVCEDYSQLDINTMIEGRNPIHDNEIAVTKLILNELNAKMHDTISLAYNGEKREYLVVGITQQISMLGRSASITEEGMKRLNEDYIVNKVYIYLQEGIDTTSFIQELNSKYANQDIKVSDNKEMIDTMLLSFNSSVTILCIACIIITAITVALILFLLIKVKILKERRQLGISKALGYTTKQLMVHVIISFLPIIIVGTAIGAVLACFGTNPTIALLLSGNGIMNCNFVINMTYVIIVPIGITVIAFVTMLLVSSRIRKITPYELFVN